MKPLVITVLTRPPSLNAYLGWKFWKKRDLKQTYAWEIFASLSGIFSLPAGWGEDRRRTMKITVFLGKGAKLLDHDNLVGGAKPLLDALKEAGVISNDSPKWLRASYVQERDRNMPRVEIVVYPGFREDV